MSEVIYRKEGHIAFITLNRPENRNAINRQLVCELREAWIDYRDDENLWVAILNGEGKCFCAGADVKEMQRGKWKFRQSLTFGDDRVAASNYGIYKPIIAAVHSNVVGAGVLLALECDIIIASDDVRFFLPEGKVNIPTLLAPFLCDYMPRAIANEMMYTGRPIDAKRAYDTGMVTNVVGRDKLMETAVQYAKEICAQGPLSLWATKEFMTRGRYLDLDGKIALIEHIATPVWNSEDSIEAKQAFIEKREPSWKLR